MKSTLKFSSLGSALVVGSILAACASGSDNNDTEGTGGSGAGGSSATGGSTSTAGNSGTGGSTAKAETPLYTFNSDLEGFAFSNVVATDPYVNLFAPGSAPVVGTPPMLGWASKDYDGAAPVPGSLMITATFSDWNQQVSVEVNGPIDKMGAPVDLSSKKVRVRVFLEKGLSGKSEAPGGAVFYLKTGTSYAWGQAEWRNLDRAGSWVTVEFDTAAPASGSSTEFDPSSPVQIGIQIASGGGGDGAAGEYGDPLETVVYIDQITWSD